MGLGLCRMRRLRYGCLCRGLEDAWSRQAPCLWAFLHRKLRKVVWAQGSGLSGAELCQVVLVAGKWRNTGTKVRLFPQLWKGGLPIAQNSQVMAGPPSLGVNSVP